MSRKLLVSGITMLLTLAVFLLLAMGLDTVDEVAAQGQDVPPRRVNAPYVSGSDNIPISRQAIFWFGQVTPSSNHVNARVAYNDQRLQITLHIFDQYLWYDTSPSAAELINWDSVSLYLQTGGSATAPDAQSYRFRAQLSNYQERARYQAASRGSGGAWQSSSVPFETEITWRGGQDGMNNLIPDRGWIVVFDIPFSSLGLGSRPNNGTLWRLAAVVHDRDDSAGTPIADRWWPENGTDLQPNSWGELHFGVPQYTPPVASARSWVTVRQGLNGAYVPDAHVGGHTNCGDPFGPLYFPNWGNANYAGYEQVNVQNQWDVADWPCFSRYYVTFPLSAIPAGKVVLSATLTLHQFGNSSPIDAEPSRIQVLTVAEDWDEGTITWNNAPLAVENIGSQVVDPIVGQANWPGVPRTWNVSRAVAQALAASQPLRLVLYSADGAYHSGKYFSSSDVPDWNAAARPTLRVWWGDIFTGEVQHNYLPLVTRR